MKIGKSTVTKLIINGIANFDPVAVYVEDFSAGCGKITITCFNDSWSYGWSSMGADNKMSDFFCSCNEHYLAGKLGNGINAWIRDEDEEVMQNVLKKEIIRRRRELSCSKNEARELWGEIDSLDPDSPAHVFSLIFEDEWWYKLPEKRNPKYDHLCRVIKTVQEAFKQLKESPDGRT